MTTACFEKEFALGKEVQVQSVPTASDARELLETLRSSYRSLSPERRDQVKLFLSQLLHSEGGTDAPGAPGEI